MLGAQHVTHRSAASFPSLKGNVCSFSALHGYVPWHTCRYRSRPQCQSKSSTMTSAVQQEQQGTPAAPPKAVDEALRAAEALLDSIKEGGGAPSMSSSGLGYTDFGYACDASGCVLVVQQDSRNATEAPFQQMLSGPNWSLGLINSSAPYYSQSFATASFGTDTSVDMQEPGRASSSSSSTGSSSDRTYAALVSGPSWRVMLSAADFADFVHMLGQLRMAVASLRFQGLWNAGSKDRPPSRAKWEGRHFKLTAIYAAGEPGFSVQMTFCHEDEFGPAVRQVSTCWPADVTAAAMAVLDETLGLRPLAVCGT